VGVQEFDCIEHCNSGLANLKYFIEPYNSHYLLLTTVGISMTHNIVSCHRNCLAINERRCHDDCTKHTCSIICFASYISHSIRSYRQQMGNCCGQVSFHFVGGKTHLSRQKRRKLCTCRSCKMLLVVLG